MLRINGAIEAVVEGTAANPTSKDLMNNINLFIINYFQLIILKDD